MPDAPLLETTVNVSRPASGHGIPAAMLASLLDSAYRSQRKKPGCLDLLITDDAEMARLNRRHLGKDNATDVLAFDDGEMDGERLRLGDIAVSADTAARVAGERGIPFEHELAFYALHGLFHLLGHRDDDDGDRAAMHRAQMRAMRGFGLTPGDGLRDF
jgi:probable rRNA maturation factor